MSNTIELKQYPSGFLGSNAVPQTSADKLKDITSAFTQMLNRAPSANKNVHTSNVEVNSIWEATIAGKEEVNSFKFKERIISCALNAFGTDTFATWLSAQSGNPEFTKYHHQFIDETILFVTEGKKRSTMISNWGLLLNSNKVDHSTLKYTDIQQKWMLSPNPDNEFGNNNISKSIKEFIHDWVKQDKGIDDLAASLFVMFGIR